MGGCSPLFLPQSPHFSFSQEDILTSILPSLTETDTVLFVFTLDGEREDGNGRVRGWRQQSDSEGLSFPGLRVPAQRWGQQYIS